MSSHKFFTVDIAETSGKRINTVQHQKKLVSMQKKGIAADGNANVTGRNVNVKH